MLDHTYSVLTDVFYGHVPEYAELDKALKEVEAVRKAAAASDTSYNTSIVVGSPTQTEDDRMLARLGNILAQHLKLIEEMRNSGALLHVTSDAASAILEARQYLLDNHYEPARLKRFDAVTFKPPKKIDGL